LAVPGQCRISSGKRVRTHTGLPVDFFPAKSYPPAGIPQSAPPGRQQAAMQQDRACIEQYSSGSHGS